MRQFAPTPERGPAPVSSGLLLIANDQLRALLDATPDAIVIVDGEGHIALIYAQTETLFGYTRDELLGQRVEILIPDRFRATHVGDRNAYAAHPTPRPMGSGLDLYGRHKSGREFPIEVSLSPVTLDGQQVVISSISDISERREGEATLRLQDSLIELARDAVIVRDLGHRIIQWNRGAEDLYGWTRSEALGQTIDTLLRTRSRESAGVFDDSRIHAGQWEGELVHTRRDGSQIVVQSRQVRIQHYGGQDTAVLEVNRDVTARREAEAAAGLGREHAERANQAKSEFLSRISHELRTPLNAVLGFAQLLELDPLSPEQQRSVTHILKAGRHLLDLINEVLDIARIESGRMSLLSEPVRVLDVVREAIDLVRPLAEERRVSLKLDELDGSREDCVLADRQRLKQVLLNLLSNAIKYNDEGGSVSVICALAADERLRLLVRDTGPGIPAEKRTLLFAPFERLEAEATAIEGTGLGLALAKGLVEAMGGTIGVESTVGTGSTFWVELRCAENSLHSQPLPAGKTPAAGTPAYQRAHMVLHIEDNLSNLELVEQILKRWPAIRVEAAMQGRLGFELAIQHQPELILLDLRLPDIGGLNILRRLQADSRTRGIPVVVVSADATSGQIERVLAAGARAYLTKPLDVRQFVDLVDSVLGLEHLDRQ